jgi:hypothetical protein
LLNNSVFRLEQTETKLNETVIAYERTKIESNALENRLAEALAAQ